MWTAYRYNNKSIEEHYVIDTVYHKIDTFNVYR